MMTSKFLKYSMVLSLVIGLGLLQQNACAQQLPSFEMQLTNGKIFTNHNLQKNKPVLLIYYAPDCEHCQALMTQILGNYAPFQKLQVVLVTFEPIGYAQSFERDYHIKKYHNIISGVEAPTFYFKNLYNLQNTPFTALFDRHHRMVISYRKMTPVPELIAHIKMLK